VSKRVEVKDLEIGMFVSELDRSWLESPFLFQGFMIENEDDLGKLQECCDYVMVDQQRSQPVASRFTRRTALRDGASITVTSTEPASTAPGRFEMAYASTHAARSETSQGVIKLLDDRRLGRMIAADVIRHSVNNLMRSVLADPSAALWLTRMRGEDEFSAAHSLNVATLSLAFARHLELPESQLHAIGMGALLHDIGLTEKAAPITRQREPLTPEDFVTLRKHPADGLYSIRDAAHLDPVIRDIIRWHHERVDGSGYPDGLSGTQIPQYVRIVAIADTYDAMVSDSAFRRGIPPGEALIEIHRLADTTFGKQTVQAFIQCIGVYPPASVVELNTGAIGVVVASNESARLLPLLLMLRDEQGKHVLPGKFVDLSSVERKTGNRWHIVKFADPSTHGIDISGLTLPGLA